MRGACWWAATRLPQPPAGVPRYAGLQRGIARASPWPLQQAPDPHRPSQGVRGLPWRSETASSPVPRGPAQRRVRALLWALLVGGVVQVPHSLDPPYFGEYSDAPVILTVL